MLKTNFKILDINRSEGWRNWHDYNLIPNEIFKELLLSK